MLAAAGTGNALHTAAAHEGLAAAVARRDPSAARRHLSDALRVYAERQMPDADRIRLLLQQTPVPERYPNGRSLRPSDH
ncbi:hypothetical protein AB0K00_14570 [Dactylosporangium sp. NPDC049525]|uniref:hypothetical protein n=1 Tax=Dactylosporangium sp. NPDC049525 TaxID=3154730 RepID=UPI0034325E01